jgi:hypothetical protein
MEQENQVDVLYMIRARLDTGRDKGAPQLRKDIRVLKRAEKEIETLRAEVARLKPRQSSCVSKTVSGITNVVWNWWNGPGDELCATMDEVFNLGKKLGSREAMESCAEMCDDAARSETRCPVTTAEDANSVCALRNMAAAIRARSNARVQPLP